MASLTCQDWDLKREEVGGGGRRREGGGGSPHLPRLGPAVAQPGDKVLAVVGVEAVEQLLPHHPQRLLHDEAAGPRLVRAIQQVVHLEVVQPHHLLHLLPPHPRLVVLHQQHQVPPSTQLLPWEGGWGERVGRGRGEEKEEEEGRRWSVFDCDASGGLEKFLGTCVCAQMVQKPSSDHGCSSGDLEKVSGHLQVSAPSVNMKKVLKLSPNLLKPSPHLQQPSTDLQKSFPDFQNPSPDFQ